MPELQQPKGAPSLTPEHERSADQARGPRWRFITRSMKKAGEDTLAYSRHPAFMASFAGTLLYFTVLSFSGQTVTYLLDTGYTPTQIAATRTVSVIFEVLATWVGPWLMAKIGPVRAGLWFSSWQVSCLAIGMSIFWQYADNSLMSTLGLVGGIILSRVGLWGFDLSVQIIVQEVSCHYGRQTILQVLTAAFRKSRRKSEAHSLPWKQAGKTYLRCARTR